MTNEHRLEPGVLTVQIVARKHGSRVRVWGVQPGPALTDASSTGLDTADFFLPHLPEGDSLWNLTLTNFDPVTMTPDDAGNFHATVGLAGGDLTLDGQPPMELVVAMDEADND